MRLKLITRCAPPEWNIRVLTDAHFYTYCDAAKIQVSEADISPQPGLYIPDSRQIVLNDTLRGPARLYVGYHELCHALTHAPGTQCFLGWDQMIEREADAFAICALIPRTILPPRFALSEIQDLYGYPDWMVGLRVKVFEKWRI